MRIEPPAVNHRSVIAVASGGALLKRSRSLCHLLMSSCYGRPM